MQVLLPLLAALAAQEPDVRFERDIAPVLEARCVRCHGPERKKAGLRLDGFDALMAGSRFGRTPVVEAGDADASELIVRITSAYEDERMPPEGEPLTDEEVRLFREWIAAGAHGPEGSGGEPVELGVHWAYAVPRAPEVPPAGTEGEDPPSPIDHFVRARLAEEGLEPAPEADRATLLRRVSLDLTGLPPSAEELDAFLGDGEPGAYERAVDRLLASPRFGERWARVWLDLARYADTHGYEKDERRTMWRYRDWVIDAFNADKPFDRFTIEQLAGDLLEEPTLDQLIATAFHRNTMINREGGIDPEEFRDDAVVDRVNTTASVWLGTTMACAQCHNHKYDPFSQKEYYEFYAFFNQTQDTGNEERPVIPAPTPDQAEELEILRGKVAAARERVEAERKRQDPAQREWEEARRAELPPAVDWRVVVPRELRAQHGTSLKKLGDHSVLAEGENPASEVVTVDYRPGEGRFTVLKLDFLTHESLPHNGPGRAGNANMVVSDVELAVVDGEDVRPVAWAAARADREQLDADFRAVNVTDGDAATSWAAAGHESREDRELVLLPTEPVQCGPDTVLRLTVRQESPHDFHNPGRFRLSVADDARLPTVLPMPALGDWVAVGPFPADTGTTAYEKLYAPEHEYLAGKKFSSSYADGALSWQRRPEWRDSAVHTLPEEVGTHYLSRTVVSQRARKLSFSIGSDDMFKLWVNGHLFGQHDSPRAVGRHQTAFSVDLKEGENHVLLKIANQGGPAAFFFEAQALRETDLPRRVVAALRSTAPLRAPEDVRFLREYYLRNVSAEGKELFDDLELLEEIVAAQEAQVPTVMVMREREEKRATHIHQRGSFLVKGDVVEAATPQVLPPLPDDVPADRLALARWLVDPANPLTARVTVNRFWEQLFGRGLVATSDDFGTRGDPPSHPALLDWLALDFVAHGWSVKHLLRTIVTSATYRQDSRVTEELLERDPQNILLARGPKFRIEAEMVRDVSLAAAGLLSDTIGGPSVMPPQPDGVWAMAYSGDRWMTADGEDRYRRGLYTFWRRTAPYPAFIMFDAPSRELACTRRPRTNTPLQALTTLNDPAYVEAAAALALRMISEVSQVPEERAAHGFRLCVSRKPAEAELAVLLELYRAEREHFGAHPLEARALLASSRREPVEGIDPAELAAWTVVANVLLNLDETLTKS